MHLWGPRRHPAQAVTHCRALSAVPALGWHIGQRTQPWVCVRLWVVPTTGHKGVFNIWWGDGYGNILFIDRSLSQPTVSTTACSFYITCTPQLHSSVHLAPMQHRRHHIPCGSTDAFNCILEKKGRNLKHFQQWRRRSVGVLVMGSILKEKHATMTSGLQWASDFIAQWCLMGQKRGLWSVDGVRFTFAELLTVSQRGETINLANYVRRIPSSGMSSGFMF